mgnify:CR=1 FL=1
MRHPYFYFLFSVFLCLYTVVNGYIFLHGYRMLEVFWIDKIAYTIGFLAFSFCYIIWEYIQQRKSSLISDGLITVGSLWFVGMVHFFFVSLMYDMFKLANSFAHWLDAEKMGQVAYYTTYITTIVTIFTIVIGYINARNPKIRTYTIKINKKNTRKKLTLAVASDIHLGPTNWVGHIERIVKKINAIKPDMVLLPGDIVDGELDPVIRRDLGKYLRKLKSEYGTYGITWNHEYIGGMERARDYLVAHDIKILQDETIDVAGVTLVGRDDVSSSRFGRQRKSLSEIVKNTDEEKPLILLDHQPKNLSEAQKNGIDIQFSGHTHNWQLWPLNLIVKRLFEVPVGYKKKGDTHIFVSTGVGTWWPPVRTNARPDILFVTVEFN